MASADYAGRGLEVVFHFLCLVAMAPMRAGLDRNDITRVGLGQFQIKACRGRFKAVVDYVRNLERQTLQETAEQGFLRLSSLCNGS